MCLAAEIYKHQFKKHGICLVKEKPLSSLRLTLHKREGIIHIQNETPLLDLGSRVPGRIPRSQSPKIKCSNHRIAYYPSFASR